MKRLIRRLVLISGVATILAAALLIALLPMVRAMFWVSADGWVCKTAQASLDHIGSLVRIDPECQINLLSGRRFVIAHFATTSGTVPVSILYRPTGDPITRVVIRVQGGPGGDALVPPVWLEDFSSFIERCNSAIVSPAYSGSYERSNYPASSHQDAEAEVGEVITAFAARPELKTHIVAESLGGNIISSPKVPIPPGGHLLFVPALQSPKEILNYFKETNPYRHLLSNTYQEVYIKKNGKLVLSNVNQFDFMKSYFGDDSKYLRQNFIDRWNEKTNVSPDAQIYLAMARDDERAGGARFAAPLEKMGMIADVIEGDHYGDNKHRGRMDRAHRWFVNQVCDDNLGEPLIKFHLPQF